MRHLFYAARAFSDLQGLPNSRVVLDRGDGNGPELQWGAFAIAYPERTALLRRVAMGLTVPGRTGSWQLYQISPLSNDPAVQRRLFRALRRAAISLPRLAGPWGPPALRRLAAALADSYASAQGPLVNDGQGRQVRSGGMPLLAGELHAQTLAIDYAPTDADCASDSDNPPPQEEPQLN